MTNGLRRPVAQRLPSRVAHWCATTTSGVNASTAARSISPSSASTESPRARSASASVRMAAPLPEMSPKSYERQRTRTSPSQQREEAPERAAGNAITRRESAEQEVCVDGARFDAGDGIGNEVAFD